MDEVWTILKVLQWTTGYFSSKGIDQPRANAEVLLAHVLDMERIQLYLYYDKPLSSAELSAYREAVRRRASREPTQYITEKQEFWSLDFLVSPAVLIPRPETELLVEKALEILGDKPACVLDLGVGSGAVAVALAHEARNVRVVATDKSIAALELAKKNALRHHVQERIFFAAMDLLSGFSASSPPFDLIVSNPPYVSDEELPDVAPEVAKNEPELALRGGEPHGLGVILAILASVSDYLKPGGVLLMEIGKGQDVFLRDELAAMPFVEAFDFASDYSGVLRALYLRKINR